MSHDGNLSFFTHRCMNPESQSVVLEAHVGDSDWVRKKFPKHERGKVDLLTVDNKYT